MATNLISLGGNEKRKEEDEEEDGKQILSNITCTYFYFTWKELQAVHLHAQAKENRVSTPHTYLPTQYLL